MSQKKRKSNKKTGERFENKVQKTIMSGGLWFSPLDIDYADFCIEAKYTDKKGYRISTDLLEKIWGQALSMNKIPRLIIGIKRNDNQTFVINCDINVEKK